MKKLILQETGFKPPGLKQNKKIYYKNRFSKPALKLAEKIGVECWD